MWRCSFYRVSVNSELKQLFEYVLYSKYEITVLENISENKDNWNEKNQF